MDKNDCTEKKVSDSKITIECLNCGKIFSFYSSKPRKYCSRECSDLGRRKGWFSNCVICNKEFWVLASRPNQKCCSFECRSVNFGGKNHPRYKDKIKLNCEFCNSEFEVQESDLSHAKYCSNECRHKANIGRNVGEKSPVYSRIEKICPVCGIQFTVKKSQNERCKDNCCCREHTNIWASRSGKFSGENNPMHGKTGELSPGWKGGENVASFDTFFLRLEPIEEVRRSPDNNDILEARCTYCNKWFKPTRNQAGSRVSAIEGKARVEHRFYCNDSNCKLQCSIYKKIKYPKGYKKATSREVSPELRKEVFLRDNWSCQRCESTKSLHCHHIEGVIQQPMLANDPENCITLCKDCHKWIHLQENCTYFDYRCKK